VQWSTAIAIVRYSLKLAGVQAGKADSARRSIGCGGQVFRYFLHRDRLLACEIGFEEAVEAI